jgi:hypothetical protein
VEKEVDGIPCFDVIREEMGNLKGLGADQQTLLLGGDGQRVMDVLLQFRDSFRLGLDGFPTRSVHKKFDAWWWRTFRFQGGSGRGSGWVDHLSTWGWRQRCRGESLMAVSIERASGSEGWTGSTASSLVPPVSRLSSGIYWRELFDHSIKVRQADLIDVVAHMMAPMVTLAEGESHVFPAEFQWPVTETMSLEKSQLA